MSSEGTGLGEGRARRADAGEQRPLTSVSTRQRHIAELARKYAGSPLTTLSHHLDLLWLWEAYGEIKNSTPGVDGQTLADYGENLEANLKSLLERAKSGRYQAPPVKRVHIPKNETETRPIGMPTVEDKVLQRAIKKLLDAVYEQEFLDCSFGFRPGRSTHQALGALREALMAKDGGWVLDVDVRKFFDTIPRQKLREVLSRRIGDGVITKLIHKWLKAGVWEAGEVTYPEAGTPQGGIISPALSNVFLHEVLDGWFEFEIKPKLRGTAVLIRYADDFVVVCEHRDDAEALAMSLAAEVSEAWYDLVAQRHEDIDLIVMIDVESIFDIAVFDHNLCDAPRIAEDGHQPPMLVFRLLQQRGQFEFPIGLAAHFRLIQLAGCRQRGEHLARAGQRSRAARGGPGRARPVPATRLRPRHRAGPRCRRRHRRRLGRGPPRAARLRQRVRRRPPPVGRGPARAERHRGPAGRARRCPPHPRAPAAPGRRPCRMATVGRRGARSDDQLAAPAGRRGAPGHGRRRRPGRCCGVRWCRPRYRCRRTRTSDASAQSPAQARILEHPLSQWAHVPGSKVRS